jgi:hypothetical protein
VHRLHLLSIFFLSRRLLTPFFSQNQNKFAILEPFKMSWGPTGGDDWGTGNVAVTSGGGGGDGNWNNAGAATSYEQPATNAFDAGADAENDYGGGYGGGEETGAEGGGGGFSGGCFNCGEDGYGSNLSILR